MARAGEGRLAIWRWYLRPEMTAIVIGSSNPGGPVVAWPPRRRLRRRARRVPGRPRAPARRARRRARPPAAGTRFATAVSRTGPGRRGGGVAGGRRTGHRGGWVTSLRLV